MFVDNNGLEDRFLGCFNEIHLICHGCEKGCYTDFDYTNLIEKEKFFTNVLYNFQKRIYTVCSKNRYTH